MPFKLELRVDSPLHPQDRERPYHVDAKVSAGATRAHAQGALVGQLQLEDFALRFEMAGDNLGDLYPFSACRARYAALRAQRSTPSTWDGVELQDFKGKIGDSDMRGDASIDLGGNRRRLQASVVSTRLDFDDLGVVVGAPPSTKPGETASPEQRKVAARAEIEPEDPARFAIQSRQASHHGR